MLTFATFLFAMVTPSPLAPLPLTSPEAAPTARAVAQGARPLAGNLSPTIRTGLEELRRERKGAPTAESELQGTRRAAAGACAGRPQGRVRQSGPGYRKDHVKPLACGGPDAVSNMQWQTIRDAEVKDRWERRACGR